MIRKLIIKGFRSLRDFTWCPQNGMNILVGDNGSGKSTILDAIELAMTCRIKGKPARGELSPYWFNREMVAEFYDALENSIDSSSVEVPKILIEAYLEEDMLGDLQGLNNSLGEDSPGLQISIEPDVDLRTEFFSVCNNQKDEFKFVPVEYFKLEWKTFKGNSILRTPNPVSCARIDSLPRSSLRALDAYARNAIEENLSDQQIRKVSNKYHALQNTVDRAILSELKASVDRPFQLENMGFKMDQSPRSDWRNSVVMDFDDVPLPYAGKGNEIKARAYIAMEKTAEKRVLLVEEPECHLSHTSLFELINLLENQLASRQMFVSTHSPFVLNRLGLDKLSLIADGNSPITLDELSNDTVLYFRRLSGYDTLRIVLARRLVLVEGPSDEMVFKWAYHRRFGRYPEADGIDVMEYGTRGKRALELSRSLGRGRVAVLRDNDGKQASEWQEDYSPYTKAGFCELFVGDPEAGTTLEPQFVRANIASLNQLSKMVGSKRSDEQSVADYMSDHKTEWALKLFDWDDPEDFACPKYISAAIDFIIADSESRATV